MDNDERNLLSQVRDTVATRRRFIRQAAGVGVGSAALLLIPQVVFADDKDEKKDDGKATATPTPKATATPTPTPQATPRPTATPTLPAPQLKQGQGRDDEAPEVSGDENYGSPRGGERDRRRLHSPKPPKRRKYIRIDHSNAGAGQTVLSSPDPDATFVVQNPAGAGIVGESTGALGGFNSVGVKGLSTAGIGVDGESTTDTGVFGGSQSHYGVHGKSDASVGVLGETSGINWGMIGRGHGAAGGGVSGTTVNRGKGIEGLAGFGSAPPPPGPPPPPPDPSTFPVIGVFGAAKSPDGVATGVLGVTHDATGKGVSGEGPFGGIGVHGFSTTGIGARGVSQQSIGIEAVSDNHVALLALSGGPEWAIIGRCSPLGVGAISGFAPRGVGIEGVTDGLGGAGVGVKAINHFRDPASNLLVGRALEVVGQSWFVSGRRWGFGPGTTVVTATGVEGAKPGAIVLATIQNPGAGATIDHALVTDIGTVEIHFAAPSTGGGDVGFFVLN